MARAAALVAGALLLTACGGTDKKPPGVQIAITSTDTYTTAFASVGSQGVLSCELLSREGTCSAHHCPIESGSGASSDGAYGGAGGGSGGNDSGGAASVSQPEFEGTNAGIVTITSEDVELTMDTAGGFGGYIYSEEILSAGAPLRVSVAGSEEVPAAQLELSVPEATELITEPSLFAATPDGALVYAGDSLVTWSGGGRGTLSVSYTTSVSEIDSGLSLVSCRFPAEDGQGVIPARMFEALEQFAPFSVELEVDIAEATSVHRSGWQFRAEVARTLISRSGP